MDKNLSAPAKAAILQLSDHIAKIELWRQHFQLQRHGLSCVLCLELP